MCGRYSLTTPAEALRRLFKFEGLLNLPARYNIAPTQMAPVVRRKAGATSRELVLLRWGLVPGWAKDPGGAARLINARAESVAEKSAFRGAFARRRCLVPADGFYEWEKTDAAKQPWHIVAVDGAPLAFAGLWERWQPPAGEALETFTIITTDANAKLAAIHDRMPAIIAPAVHAAWLDPATPAADCKALLAPCPPDAISAYKVSTRVNNVRNDDAGCIARMEQLDLL